jgi:hypothetical protein
MKELSRRFPKFSFSTVGKKYVPGSHFLRPCAATGPPTKKARMSAAPAPPIQYFCRMAIPFGRKYYAWFTFYKTWNVLVFIDAQTHHMVYRKCANYSPVFWGTLLYGTLVRDSFVAENIFYFEGKHVSHEVDLETKMDYMISSIRATKLSHRMTQPTPTATRSASELLRHHEIHLWVVPIELYCNSKTREPANVDSDYDDDVKAVYRYYLFSETEIFQKPNDDDEEENDDDGDDGDDDSTLPPSSLFSASASSSASFPTIQRFWVGADLQSDIYYLYKNEADAVEDYVDLLMVPNLKTSVFLNTRFLKIRENENLDFAEESDDEEEFQNVRDDKYVDLSKRVFMQCEFHPRFQKWVPIVAPLGASD